LVSPFTETSIFRKVCLSLGRSGQCEELLGIAAWLFIQSSGNEENYEMQAEICRLFGQLYVLQVAKRNGRQLILFLQISPFMFSNGCFLQNKLENALQAFAEEIYYVSMKHGVLDIRTSIGFYNIFKVLKSLVRKLAYIIYYVDDLFSSRKPKDAVGFLLEKPKDLASAVKKFWKSRNISEVVSH
jgi:hypothetical protein